MNRISQDFHTPNQSKPIATIRSKGRPERLVEVNVSVCHSLAASLRNRSIPPDREDVALPNFSSEELGNFYLFLVAICHQTSPFGKPPLEGTVRGRHLKGWDYLSAKLEGIFREKPTLFQPRSWNNLTGEDLIAFFYDDEFGNRLTKPEHRAALVRDLGSVMVSHSWKNAHHLYLLSGRSLATAHPNLLELLSTFKAYRDPVRKKSYFFLSVMRNAGVWKYVDDEHLGAPVDYHETRGHLRLGTVSVRKKALRQKLISGQRVTQAEDTAIRQAVHDAIILISNLSGLNNPSQLHYLFWNVFRSCCSRESPHCNECPPDCSLPNRYVPLAIHPDGTRSCPFASLCASKCVSHKLYNEQRFETDYY